MYNDDIAIEVFSRNIGDLVVMWATRQFSKVGQLGSVTFLIDNYEPIVKIFFIAIVLVNIYKKYD